MNDKHNISILASHNGSHLKPIYEAMLQGLLNIDIKLIISNNSDAQVLKKAKSYNLKSMVINDNNTHNMYEILKQHKCKYIILSGYMKKLSSQITNNFIIINSHPSLLPKYGGVGMYGKFVHQKVIENKEKQSGITFHYVNENYDEGKIILQKSLTISENDTIDSLENKIKILEQNSIVEVLKLCLK
jgi:phosphoribosylglycinamide formyltransferase-1